MAFNLIDSSGQGWVFDITDAGQLTSARVSATQAEPRAITDYATGSIAFSLGVTTGGLITTTSLGASRGQQNAILMISSGGVKWYLICTRLGILQGLYGPNPVPPSVGYLAGVDGSYPTPSQPGGPGTVVLPAQTANEQSAGKLRAGCGHSFNSWEVRSVTSGPGQAALILCPLCSYVQRVLYPFSEIYNNQTNPIIQA